MNRYITTALVGVGLTTLTYAIIMVATGVFGIPPYTMNALEVFAVATGYSCTYLCVLQDRWNYPLGAVATASLCIVFWQGGLFASALTNLYLPLALLYGWFRWGSNGNPRPVTQTSPTSWLLQGAVATGLYMLVVLIMDMLGANLPMWDAVILAGTILAQFMLDNKKLETWFVWAVVDIVAVVVYVSQGYYFAGVQMGFFLLNAAWGYHMWRKHPYTGVVYA